MHASSAVSEHDALQVPELQALGTDLQPASTIEQSVYRLQAGFLSLSLTLFNKSEALHDSRCLNGRRGMRQG